MEDSNQDGVAAISPDAAQKLLEKKVELSAAEVASLLRFLKRANDDVLGKLRQLKSEIGRVARK
jgi:hypothetical protein